ncbi:MAG TPA: ABC transporter permease [Chloroflexia bacterium]|nr:ABC transporter permease [Chloroflexia bacterium]
MIISLLKLGRPRKEEPVEVQNYSSVMAVGDNSAAHQNARNIPLLIGREYNTRVRKRSFVITTVILTLLVIVAATAPTIIQILTSNSQTKLAVVVNPGVGQVGGQEIVPVLDTLLNTNIDSSGNTSTGSKKDFAFQPASPAQEAQLRQEVKDGKQDALLVVNRSNSGELTFSYYSNGSQNSLTGNRVRLVTDQLNFLDRLSRLGVPQSQLSRLYQPTEFKSTNTTDEKNGRTAAETGAAYILVTAGIILLFTAILNFGAAVAQGAVEEKSNRVMEIMVNAATPFQLMMGKIVGIGLAGFTQIGIMGVVGAIAFMVQTPIKNAFLSNSTSSGTDLNVTSLSLGLLGLVVLYFVLGFLLYATLYAAIGSMVSRMEDVQTALTPLTFIFMAAYFASFFALNMPDVSWVVVLSYVPFFTPMMMLVRAGLGTLNWWDIPLSIILMIVAIWICTILAARIYRAGVLMYGQKPTMGKLFKLAFSR